MFEPALAPSPDLPSERLWIAVRGTEVLLVENGDGLELPLGDDLGIHGIEPEASHFLGTLRGIGCVAAAVSDAAEAGAGYAFHGLRPLWTLVGEELFGLAGRAVQIVEWERTHQFCGRCATPTVQSAGERAKRCPGCGLLSFPRVSPAMIVRVTRGDEILLAQGARFPGAFYSVLAGFVDPGESLEQCVAREVREEVGIQVAGIRYFGSQPWPFPHSLMVGFTAEHAGGEIDIDPEEIVHAGWFRRDDLPEIPPSISIARRLIDDWTMTASR